MLNKTFVQGRLVADPEIRHTSNGISVASFRIAWSDKRKENESKLFINCTAWRGTADFLSQYFRKGQEILVEGKLQTRSFQDKNGNDRQTTELTADQVHFCGRKNDNQNHGNYGGNDYSYQPDVPFPDDDDELPFM